MGLWDTVASVGSTLVGGLLGGAGGNNNNNASATTTTDPWKVQQPYLLGGFADASQAYNALKTQPYYQGDLYAGMTPLQNQAIAGTQQFATGSGAQTTSNMLGASNAALGGSMGQMMSGTALMGFNPTGGPNLNRYFGYNPGQATNASPLTNFNPGQGTSFGALTNFRPGNATIGNIMDASMYADNPYMDGMIDAASRDVTRNLTEDVLPGINRLGSATGNTNSSRTGVAEGIALRGAQDRLGDIASGLRGDAYQQGLGLAENARSTNMNARLNALQSGLAGTEGARQFNTGTRLDALNSGLNLAEQGRQYNASMRYGAMDQGTRLGEDARQANMNARLNALTNAGNIYGNAFGQGLQGSAAGLTAGYNNLDALSKAGALQQQDAQGRMNANFAQWQGQDQRAFDLLDRYMQAVGGQYGSTKTATANNGQPGWLNTLQGAAGGAAAGLGLYGQYKDIFSQQ